MIRILYNLGYGLAEHVKRIMHAARCLMRAYEKGRGRIRRLWWLDNCK